MPETTGSPQLAPEYALHRYFKAAALELVDPTITDPKMGMNMSAHHYAHVQVVPLSAGAAPAVEVLVWCQKAGKFISENPAASKTAPGDNIPYEFTVSCRGRRIFVAVTGGLVDGEEVEVYVAGFDTEKQ